MSRETETRVFILDQAQLEAAARAQAVTVYGMSEEEAARIVCLPQALIRQGTDPRGRFAVICGEGVGFESDEYTRVVEIFAGTMSMMDCYSIRFHDHVLSKMVLDATPLAEHVRTFGARLEGNFHKWSSWANKQTGGEPLPR